MSNFLLEIGTEELPAEFARLVLPQLIEIAAKDLKEKRLNYGDIYSTSTPRRIVLQITDLASETDDYAERIRAVRSVLDGDALLLIKNLQKEMEEHIKNLRYEAAARSRDLIAAVQQTLAQQVIPSRFYQDCDAVGFANQGDL